MLCYYSVLLVEEIPMKVLAKMAYIVALLIVATLPFNPVLNKRFVAFPLCLVCVAIGLTAMYVSTLPEKPRSQRNGDIK
jgi:hypothetical protein